MSTTLDETIEKLEQLVKELKMKQRNEKGQNFDRGDVVTCIGNYGNIPKAIVLADTGTSLWAMVPDDEAPQKLPKDQWAFQSTGDYINFDQLLRWCCREEREG